MTPSEVLTAAMEQFTPLYYNDTDKLESLLKRALGVYQDKAGFIKSVKTSGTDAFIEIPTDALEPIFACDSTSRYHEVIEDTESGTWSVTEDANSIPVYTFHYFVNLRDYDFDTDLPPGIVGTLIDYVAALIDVPNTDRARAIAVATGRQVELPTNDEMTNRKAIIELYMEENRAIVPMISVY